MNVRDKLYCSIFFALITNIGSEATISGYVRCLKNYLMRVAQQQYDEKIGEVRGRLDEATKQGACNEVFDSFHCEMEAIDYALERAESLANARTQEIERLMVSALKNGELVLAIDGQPDLDASGDSLIKAEAAAAFFVKYIRLEYKGNISVEGNVISELDKCDRLIDAIGRVFVRQLGALPINKDAVIIREILKKIDSVLPGVANKNRIASRFNSMSQILQPKNKYIGSMTAIAKKIIETLDMSALLDELGSGF